jgi:hypothetical protein
LSIRNGGRGKETAVPAELPTDSATDHWIVAAEAKLAGKPCGRDDLEVIRATRPPVIDAETLAALGSILLTAIVWAAAVFREQVSQAAFDPLALLLRLLALGFTVRALLLGAGMARRLSLVASAQRQAIVLAPEGLLYRSADADIVMPIEDIIAIVERGDWRGRAGRRSNDVYVVTGPGAGRAHVALPPIFEATPGVLAERLMRWRGLVEGMDAPRPEPTQLASKLYDEVAAGARPPGIAVIRHGRGWLVRGPYASVLLGIAVLIGFARLPAGTLSLIGPTVPIAIGVCLALVPALWVWLVRREIRPRKGLALVLTPAEALMRARAGIVRVAWKTIGRLSVQVKPSWSLLEGSHGTRTLLVQRRDAPDVRYDEAFLGVPAEVALALCDAYRRGVLPRPETTTTATMPTAPDTRTGSAES